MSNFYLSSILCISKWQRIIFTHPFQFFSINNFFLHIIFLFFSHKNKSTHSFLFFFTKKFFITHFSSFSSLFHFIFQLFHIYDHSLTTTILLTKCIETHFESMGKGIASRRRSDFLLLWHRYASKLF